MNRIFLPLLIATAMISACGAPVAQEVSYASFRGETMGTWYSISHNNPQGLQLQAAVDSLLQVINQEVSTYIPNSTISRFNQSNTGLDIGLDYFRDQLSGETASNPSNWHFARNYVLSQVVRESVGSNFDPTVMPLVNYWGFGYEGKEPVSGVDSSRVDSLLDFVGFEQVSYQGTLLTKSAPGVQLDFSAVAKGYAVDEIGRFLENKGIRDYMVEIGGEVRTRGRNSKGSIWVIGINTPSADAAVTDVQLAVQLEDRSLATSGNYRNFYEVDGRKYVHTINPATGYPELNDLLSASVFTSDCALADGLATGFMVMGFEEARQLVNTLDGVEACFIYGQEDGSMGVYYTPGLESYVLD